MKHFLSIIMCALALGTAMGQRTDEPGTASAARGEAVCVGEQAGGVRLSYSADTLAASLITCSPGKEAYTLFGHTAIRLRDVRMPEMDIVFNYGVFDYNSQNFILRFVLGETDYTLAAEPAAEFFYRYAHRGYTVWEQELRLSSDQRERLRELLAENYRPENRVYRYNFLYDNCTTRARDMLERAAGTDSIAYDNDTSPLTFREILHRFTADSPWLGFGIDMVLGAEVDCLTSSRQRMFIPSLYQGRLDRSLISLTGQADTEQAPFVVDTQVYPPRAAMEDSPSFPLTPAQAGWLLLAAACALSVAELRRRDIALWFDILLYTLQGAAGVIVAFLFFFSAHPAVGSNWLVAALNPLAFLLIAEALAQRKHRRPLIGVKGWSALQCANMAVLAFTLLLFCLPLQWIHPALLPMVLTLTLRCACRLRKDRPSAHGAGATISHT